MGSVFISNPFIIKALYPSIPTLDVKGALATSDNSRNTKEE